MKIRAVPMLEVISLERVVKIELEEDDEVQSEELNPGIYAMDSTGCLWKQHETGTGLLQELTEHDGIKRSRKKRVTSG